MYLQVHESSMHEVMTIKACGLDHAGTATASKSHPSILPTVLFEMYKRMQLRQSDLVLWMNQF